MASQQNPTRRPPVKKVAPPPIKPAPKKRLFQSDMPLEQAAYEGTVEALGYEPVLHPYIDEEYKAVCAKWQSAKQALAELSEE